MKKALFIIHSMLGSYGFQLKTAQEKGRRERKDEWHHMGCCNRDQMWVESVTPIS